MEGFIREAAQDRERTRYKANAGMNGANSYQTTGRSQSENEMADWPPHSMNSGSRCHDSNSLLEHCQARRALA